MQGKVCGKKRHTKTEIRSEISELICGRIAAGENYNLTRDIKQNLPFGAGEKRRQYTSNILISYYNIQLILHNTQEIFIKNIFL